MMYRISEWKSASVFLSSVMATLLLIGPVLFAPAPGSNGEGVAWAGKFDKGGGGGGKGTMPQKSKIDRKPRASSAKQGSMKEASRERPGAQQQAKARPQAKPQAKAKPQVKPQQRASGSPKDQPFAGKADGKPQQQAKASSSRENLAARDQKNPKHTSAQQAAKKPDTSRLKGGQDRQTQRADRDKQVKEGRQQYAANKQDIRSDRKKAAEELQQNKFDHRDEAREDRQDWADESREDRQKHQRQLANERRDLYEDIYDDRRYWGNNDNYWDDDDDDDDDNNGWLWGIGGAIVGGVAGYAIGAAVNEPPEGTVAVPVDGVPYQYYGGAFYEPAPSGTGYVTAPAPVGAQVEAPPIDCTIVFGPEDEGYCYFQGAFFIYDDSADQYVVVEPPADTSVTYLPPGYEEVTVAGTKYMKLGSTYYRPYYEGDEVTYVVSEV
jgi:hypothetical protein